MFKMDCKNNLQPHCISMLGRIKRLITRPNHNIVYVESDGKSVALGVYEKFTKELLIMPQTEDYKEECIKFGLIYVE